MSQAAAFCIVALLAALAGVSASPYDPHAPDDSVASWFEASRVKGPGRACCQMTCHSSSGRPLPRSQGWYLRVLTSTMHSDPSAPSSLGVITGGRQALCSLSHQPPAGRPLAAATRGAACALAQAMPPMGTQRGTLHWWM